MGVVVRKIFEYVEKVLVSLQLYIMSSVALEEVLNNNSDEVIRGISRLKLLMEN